MTNNKH